MRVVDIFIFWGNNIAYAEIGKTCQNFIILYFVSET